MVIHDKEAGTVHLMHKGLHNHAIPHPIRGNIDGKKQLEAQVKTAPEVHPKQLLIGSMTRESASNIHAAYANLDRLSYERKKILKGTSIGTTLSAITAFKEQEGITMISSSSISNQDGHISFQTNFMKEQAAMAKTCMKSDSVHGFV